SCVFIFKDSNILFLAWKDYFIDCLYILPCSQYALQRFRQSGYCLHCQQGSRNNLCCSGSVYSEEIQFPEIRSGPEADLHLYTYYMGLPLPDLQTACVPGVRQVHTAPSGPSAAASPAVRPSCL